MSIKIDLETAENEFMRFVDTMDLDIECETEEEEQDLKKSKKPIIKAIIRGDLVINEEGEPIYNTIHDVESQKIHFHMPTGASFQATEKAKSGNNISALYAYMAELTRLHPSNFAKMKKPDLKVCMAIGTLFLVG